MGREKRIAESRAKDLNDKKKEADPGRPRPAAPVMPSASSGPAAVAAEQTGLGRAIVQIVALYAVPILLIVLVGKLILKL